MTFLAPSFVFAFLPIVITAYALVPKHLKTYALIPVGLAFYVFVNIESLFALIALPIIVLSVLISVELYKRRRIRLGLKICRAAFVLSIFAVLALRVAGAVRVLSGIGVIIVLMSAVSICSDLLWGQGRVPDSMWDTLAYLVFFPLLMVGPFVKYGDFVEKTDKLDFGIECFTSGAINFVVGFVKCVAISAVLNEAYIDISTALKPSPDIFSIIILILIRGLGFFCFISGYSDMAVGISSMLGIRVGSDYGNIFCNVTPCEFIRNFFSSLLDFCRSYITVPVSLIISGWLGTVIAAVFAAFLYAVIFPDNADTVFSLMIPLSVAMVFIVRRTGIKRKKIALFPRIIGCTMTFLLAMTVIWYIYIGGPEELQRLLTTKLAYSSAPGVVAAMRNIKYITIPTAAGVCVWLTKLLFKRDEAYLDGRQSGIGLLPHKDKAIKLVAKYAISTVLLVLFAFSVIMLLPQYPYLASTSYFFPFV